MRFRLVDRILELDAAKHVPAEKWIPPEVDYFVDHFPGYPTVPAVLLVEMMAHAAGEFLLADIARTQWPVLVQVTHAHFRKNVKPGSIVGIDATIESCNDRTVRTRGCITCKGARVAVSSLMFGSIPKDLLAANLDDKMLRLSLMA